MTFLELVELTHLESGSGGSAPANVEGQVGEAARLVQWVRQADLWVQSRHSDWQFLWGQEAIQLSAGSALYTPVALTQEYDRQAAFLDGNLICVVDYLEVKHESLPSSPGKPYRVVVMPDRTLRADPEPDDDYELRVDYWAKPVPMQISSDNSLVPSGYEYTIIGKALMYYGEYEAAPEVLQKGATMLGEWLPKLESRYLPGDRHAHAIAEGNDWVMSVE